MHTFPRSRWVLWSFGRQAANCIVCPILVWEHDIQKSILKIALLGQWPPLHYGIPPQFSNTDNPQSPLIVSKPNQLGPWFRPSTQPRRLPETLFSSFALYWNCVWFVQRSDGGKKLSIFCITIFPLRDWSKPIWMTHFQGEGKPSAE